MSEADGSAPLVLGTRGSELALAQAGMVRGALEAKVSRELETRIIKTSGDQRQDLKFTEFSRGKGGEPALLDKGIFTKELEEALRAREIDAAVHSLKDVPSEIEGAFTIAGVLRRAAVEDVLIAKEAKGIDELREGARVGTGSVRRQCLLRRLRPDLEVIDIRGNVPTRIRKLAEQADMDAIILARAGLERLGQARLEEGVVELEGGELRAEILDSDRFVPAACQGIVAMEIRSGDAVTAEAIEAINDEVTFLSARAERAFLRFLGAGCQTPVGVHSRAGGAGGIFRMRAIVFNEAEPDKEPLCGEVEGEIERPEELAERLFEALG